MLKAASAAAVLALFSPAFAGAAAPARPAKAAKPATAAQASEQMGMLNFSLIEALAAIHQPQLSGIFSFVAEKNAPFAFADYLARDKKSMKLYFDKLDADVKAASGLTEWDHEVCAALINLYSAPLPPGFDRPDDKRMKQINDSMLAATLPLEMIVSRRKK